MNSMRLRLTVMLAVLCCLVWCGGGLATYLAMRSGLLAEFDSTLINDARALSTLVEPSKEGVRFEVNHDLMAPFARRVRPHYFEVWASNGSTIKRSPSLADKDLPIPPGSYDHPKFWNLILPDGLHGRAIAMRFIPKEEEGEVPPSTGDVPPPSDVTLVMAFHRDPLDRRLDFLASVLLIVGAAMVIATALAAATVVRWGLQPLSTLAGRTALIDASSLRLRFPTNNLPSELVPIGQCLNDVLERLEASFARERRFSADVSHELRTPIAELRALTEVAVKWPDDRSVTQDAIKDALAIALQMESITTGLLALARCEGNLFIVRAEPILLEGFVEEILESCAIKTREKGLAISLDITKQACWFTDRIALHSIIANLVANAVEHSARASTIHARVESVSNVQRFAISNRTENLLPEDLAHIFDRFWRKDPARSATARFGLGLAVAKAYAQLLGMDVRGEFTNAAEITFTLSGARPCP